ncbi:GDPGTP exchange factor Sec2p [Cordyceps fumosorosea ARSEF 2679]|uniref:GDPGTP exchange factor Sec2p n=1 Tax=Cordyceps fumosorosea (strain ARSEF 2679) TaxID=1081104 RepID=A0A168DDE8_CORFA|nr:GDPGTP exchange factor Sec2p [Cordyceps fumosorosea ARSEF 2679]OAA72473.1 GDPGTP exchange factor Sec2p [Cordyceps fumosorosea ARSEF 2679]
MVATVAQPSLSIKASAAASHCPSCGADVPEDLAAAQARIAELEGEVRALNDKAATAINRWAEYEVELTRLRSTSSPRQQRPSPTRSSPSSYLQQSTERISALLYSRKPSTSTLRAGAPLAALQTTAGAATGAGDSSAAATPSTPTHMNEDLLEALNREQGLRREAEGRLSATSREMEELSAALFEQANEMVADERRARAKLEERVGELERRDAEKKKRLDRLESAMARIERVRNLLRE